MKKDLPEWTARMKERGLTEERAEIVVYGFFDSTMKTLKIGEEIPVLGSDAVYIKRMPRGLQVYAKA